LFEGHGRDPIFSPVPGQASPAPSPSRFR